MHGSFCALRAQTAQRFLAAAGKQSAIAAQKKRSRHRPRFFSFRFCCLSANAFSRCASRAAWRRSVRSAFMASRPALSARCDRVPMPSPARRLSASRFARLGLTARSRYGASTAGLNFMRSYSSRMNERTSASLGSPPKTRQPAVSSPCRRAQSRPRKRGPQKTQPALRKCCPSTVPPFGIDSAKNGRPRRRATDAGTRPARPDYQPDCAADRPRVVFLSLPDHDSKSQAKRKERPLRSLLFLICGASSRRPARRRRRSSRFQRRAWSTSAGKSRSRRRRTPSGSPPAYSRSASCTRSSCAAR